MPVSTAKPASSKIDRRRRKHPRYRVDFRVNVSYFEAERFSKLEAHGRDLSEAGIGILLAAELKSGEVVNLNFSLSDVACELRAVVRYRQGYHYGFEFLSLSREQQDSLRAYLKDLPAVD